MASVYKRGKCWYLNWADAAGCLHRVSLGPVTAADARAALTRHRLNELKNPLAVAPAPTLKAFSSGYLAWYRVQYPSSYDRVKSIFDAHLLPDFGTEPLNLITRDRVIEWRNGRVEDASVPTVNKEMKTLKAALQRAVDWKVIDRNPMDRGSEAKGRDLLYLAERGDKVPRGLDSSQLLAIYAKSSKRNAALWRLMANTGIRRNEMLALKWANLHADRMVVESLEERPTKGRRTRVIPLSEPAKDAAKVLGECKQDDVYVLRQMTLHSLSRAFQLDAKRGGLVAHIHQLRHAFCYALVRQGVHPRIIQELAGHADIKTTERYMWAAPDLQTAAVTQLAL